MGKEEKDPLDNIAEEVAEARSEDAFEPFVDGLKKIAKHVTDTKRKTEDKLTDIETRMKNEVHGLTEKVERGMGDILDRVEDMSKRSSVFGRFNIEQDDLSAIKSATPERFMGNINQYEQFKTGDGIYADPRYIAAKHAWFNVSAKLQLRKYDSDRETLRGEYDKLTKTLDQIQKADMGGVVDTSGGYAVPNIVGSEVLKIIRDASLIYSRARQLPMTSDTLQFPDEATAVSVGWHRTDGTAITAGEPVFGQKTLTANKLVGKAIFSLELLDDANVAIVPFLQSCFAEQMGANLDAQAMEGSGSPFTGVATATTVNDGVVTTNGTLGQTLTYASSTATYASLVRIYTKAAQGVVINGGTWVCGPSVYGKIIGLTDNTGQPIVRLGTVEGQPNNTLFGRPIIVSSALVNVTLGAGTNSVGGLYYGQMSQLLFGTRQGLRWDVSDQIKFDTYQAMARMVGRFGFVVGVPTAWVRNLGIAVA